MKGGQFGPLGGQYASARPNPEGSQFEAAGRRIPSAPGFTLCMVFTLSWMVTREGGL